MVVVFMVSLLCVCATSIGARGAVRQPQVNIWVMTGWSARVGGMETRFASAAKIGVVRIRIPATVRAMRAMSFPPSLCVCDTYSVEGVAAQHRTQRGESG